ncbi:TPA: hypothetical protein ACTYED_004852 [Escherichia coli]|nr:hypothetical protein [Escherichia coli]HBA6989804.1 hypothetical protein [Escherichia coli]HBA8009778.1 hypothetical protein [Escherichia coli]HBA8332210.1 hypothetical protein [Escherichia coli]HBA9149491.1 hypothetical protein [Escherichia coli]
MKKTLIALAVAASAAVSGSAMAWTANGTGGSVELGGTLNPVEKVTPWEVKVGDDVTGLDAQIKKGQKEVSIFAPQDISILGIRSKTNTFGAQQGISPQIDYAGHVDLRSGSWENMNLNLDVLDQATSTKIGSLFVENFKAAGGVSMTGTNADGVYSVKAPNAGNAFHGGIRSGDKAGSAESVMAFFNGEVSANFSEQGMDRTFNRIKNFTFNDFDTAVYSAFYGSGIKKGEKIRITLDNPAGTDEIVWKASLPVTVTYM